jgi:nicotinamide N-methyltransferase
MHLLRSAKKCLANTKEAKILVPFSHHRPHLADKDMNFFKLAEEMGFECVKHEDSKMTAMFEKDPGSLEVRETIHFYSLTRMCLEE